MKIKTWHALVFLSCAVLVAYYPAFSAPFNLVDDSRLVNHLMSRTDFTWRDLIIPDSSSYYRPLVNSSFVFDRIVWGMEAPLMHMENILLHLLNTFLLFSLTKQICRTHALHSQGIPLATALIFGLHAINSEAVVWVAGRADLLVGLFVLLTLNAFWLYLVSRKTSWILLAAICFFLGTLSKETALFLLPGLFLLSMTRNGRQSLGNRQPGKSLVKNVFLMSPFVVGTTGYFLIRSWALRGRDLGLKHVVQLATDAGSSVGVGQHVSDTQVIETISLVGPLLVKAEQALKISGFYAKKLFWPFPLNFGIINVPEGYFWVGLLLILTAVALLWRRTLAGNLALTAMCLASISLLVSFGEVSWTPVAERYMYAPSAVFCLSCTLGFAELPGLRHPHRQVALIACVLLVFFVGTFQRCQIWQDNVSLFSDTVEKSPEFSSAKNELALALLARGEKEQAYDILRSLELPDFQAASLNKIMVLVYDGRLHEARALLLERLQNPGSYETIIQLKLIKVLESMMLSATNEPQKLEYREEALFYLKKVWQKTKDPFYLYRMGQLRLAAGDEAGARESFKRAAKLLPDDSLYKEPAKKLAESFK